jgi:hypothetical protein
LAVGVTGAHYYGFPSADSDLDLKGVHVADTREIVSLRPPADAIDFLGLFDGVDRLHEPRAGGDSPPAAEGNGNMLERICPASSWTRRREPAHASSRRGVTEVLPSPSRLLRLHV